MSTIESTVGADTAPQPTHLIAAAMASVALATLVGFLAYPEGGDGIPVWFAALAAGIAAVAVFGFALPRSIQRIDAGHRTRAPLVLGIVAAVTALVLFGVGLSFVFGIAAVWTGWAQRAGAGGGRAAIGLGAAACIADLTLALTYFITGWP